LVIEDLAVEDLAVEDLAVDGLAVDGLPAVDACVFARPDFEPGLDVSAGARFAEGFGRTRALLFFARGGRMILAMFGV
jgi:hypothetical protein